MSYTPKTKHPKPTFEELKAAAHNQQLLEVILKFAEGLCERLYLVRAYGRPAIRCFKDPNATKNKVDIVVFFFYCTRSYIHLRYSDSKRNLQAVNIENLNDFNNIKQAIIDGYKNF